MDAFKNADGTYNGVKLMASISGLSEAEVDWTWKRLHFLRQQGIDPKDAKKQVAEEAKLRPWELNNEEDQSDDRRCSDQR